MLDSKADEKKPGGKAFVLFILFRLITETPALDFLVWGRSLSNGGGRAKEEVGSCLDTCLDELNSAEFLTIG